MLPLSPPFFFFGHKDPPSALGGKKGPIILVMHEWMNEYNTTTTLSLLGHDKHLGALVLQLIKGKSSLHLLATLHVTCFKVKWYLAPTN